MKSTNSLFSLLLIICNISFAEKLSNEDIQQLKILCLSPDSQKSTHDEVTATGEVDAKVKYIARADANAKYTKKSWEGVPRVLQEQQLLDNASYRKCIQEMLPLFIKNEEKSLPDEEKQKTNKPHKQENPDTLKTSKELESKINTIKSTKPYTGEKYTLKAKIIKKTALNLRKSKALSSSNIIRVVKNDEIFFTHIQANRSEWLSVKTKDGEVGFLKRKYVSIFDNRRFYKKATVDTYTGKPVILRNTPVKKKGNEIGGISEGDVFYTYPQSKIHKYKEVLVKTKDSFKIGYISRKYIRYLKSY